MVRLSVSQKPDRKKTLAAFAFEKEAAVLGFPADKKLLQEAKAEGFTGKPGSAVILHPKTQNPSRLVLLIGLGERKKLNLEGIRRGAALAAKKVQALSQSGLGLSLPGVLGAKEEAMAASEGILLAKYSFDKYKKKREDSDLKEATLIVSREEEGPAKEGAKFGQILSEAACMARDIVNEPPSDMTPLAFAGRAQEVAEEGKSASITIKILGKKEMEEQNMGAILGVARGSAEPPQFIHMHYKHPEARKSIALVGKGITFDSGGLSLKSPENMETMKMDMAGAASILAVFSALPRVKPKIEVHGIMALTENMPGGRAQKPGDILRTYSGKSIEVLNTDAEGRLVLADGLAYAVKQKPDEIVDIATLTGACVIALGSLVAGSMGNNEDLLNRIKTAGEKAGERFWPLPLVEDYKEGLKSPVADVKNISSIRREAGSIIGGLFLQEFTDDRPWVHLDIAGPAWTDRELPYCKPGGTGFPARTLIHYILNNG